MTRHELIQFIKENNPQYAHFTFGGHSMNDLLFIKEKIEEEKQKMQSSTGQKIAHLIYKLFH